MKYRANEWLAVSIVMAVLTAAVFARPASAAAADRPNVIIVFMDDMGYQDVGCFGSPTNKTPNIDRLAKEGCRFTDFYSAYCVCSASRASLMTGSYQPRLSMPGVLGPHSRVGLHPDEITIADALKARGYATMCVGKWHLGDSPQTLPTAQGFDHYFGLPYSNDMARKKGYGNDPNGLDKIWKEKIYQAYNNELYRDDKIIEQPVNQVTLTDRYTDESLKFIRKNKDKPFFLYLAQTMVHVPLFVSDERYDPDPHKAYKLTVEHVDNSVGQVLALLDELKLVDNTLFIYTSDNGPWLSKKHHAGSALPLRAGKATTFEGGMRVPSLMRWPKRIKAGTTCSQVAGTIDLLPTLAKITGYPLPADRPIDGRDIGALFDDPANPSPHLTEGYFYYKNSRVEAIRAGKWKLRVAGNKPELYDLHADISESKDVSAENPEVVSKLQQRIAEYDTDLKAHVRPVWKREQDPAKPKKKRKKKN